MGAVSPDQGPRSSLLHLVSDPHTQNTFRAWLSAFVSIPRLADGAFTSVSRVLNVELRIIEGDVGVGSGAELA